ncbi:MAG: 3'-5' exonuclease [Bacilli bacterium]|nr:3'-5' exonuclease [Bacilli bacterium]
MNYLIGLNPNQKAAVTSQAKYLRVIAGAGSGKTKVLTHRIAYLINDLGIPSERILAITFTNKAADEMRHRVESLLEDHACRSTIKTFHSFCVRVLREDGRLLGYAPNFEIVDDEDQKKIVKNLAKDMPDDRISTKEYLNYISYKKSLNVSVEGALNMANSPYDEQRATMYKQYQDYLENKGYLDFDDLIIKTVTLFKEHPNIREKWQSRFSDILVDEFQDTNDIQYNLIRYLVAKDTSLFVVGDPDQTIYTWRGANMKIIMNFKRDFKGAVDIVLDTNYRSTQSILNGANALIQNNQDRVKKNLETENGLGGKIIYYHGDSTNEEAYWVAGRIQELMKLNPQENYGNVAILYRSNYYSAGIENELLKAHIPYAIYGGHKFFDRKEVKDAICYLRVVVNPNDDLAFERIINEPRRGVGDKALSVIKLDSKQQKVSLYNALDKSTSRLRQSGEISRFFDAIIHAQEALKANKVSYGDVLNTLLEDANYTQSLEVQQTEESNDRLDNINQLKNFLFELQQENPDRDLIEILQETALFSDQDEIKNSKSVSLMTIHTAKGLEFDYVFLVGLSEGVLPNMRSLTESKDGLEEERRLAYVAFTRAKKQLFLSSAEGYNYATGANSKESRFVDEVRDYISDYYIRHTKKYSSITPAFKKEKKMVFNEKEENVTWRPGDLAVHTVFGEGVVIIVDGDTLTIAFKDSKIGSKMIAKGFSGLSKKK